MTELQRMSLSCSEDEEEFGNDESDNPSMKGVLSKWTNYIHGWQDRFVCCRDGTLCYYRTQDETEYGCRGSISLTKSTITSNEFDPCRFDITINDSTWYLRAPSETEKQQWIDVIEANKLDAEDIGLRRHGSMLSLGSGPSITSSSSFRKTHGLKEKLAELETFRDILDRQVNVLQKYFDACATHMQPKDNRDHWTGENEIVDDDSQINLPSFTSIGADKPLGFDGVDFKGEAITFKATTNGVLTTLSYCIELMNKREEIWQKRLDKEQERRKRIEEQYSISLAAAKKNVAFLGSPDFEEGPQSGLTEEEFFDAVEAELDRQERVNKDIEHSRSLIREAEKQPKGEHRLSDELEKQVQNHLSNSLQLPTDDNSWELFAEEGEMKVFRKELVEDGLICDPLKAIHSIKRVTAREMCHYFWDTDVRLEWEGTIESFRVLEVLDERTIIIYQTHKRVWPSAQRDCLYLSSMLKIDNPVANDGKKPHDTWMVCNFSVDHNDANPVAGCVRATVEICLICQTFVTPPKSNMPLDRDCLHCEIVYVANVNPGGWAPASVLRAIYKREYPKFLRRFTAYVQTKTKDKQILF